MQNVAILDKARQQPWLLYDSPYDVLGDGKLNEFQQLNVLHIWQDWLADDGCIKKNRDITLMDIRMAILHLKVQTAARLDMVVNRHRLS